MVDNIRILSSVIKLIGTETIRISAIYRSHHIKKYEFVHSLNILNTKNHCIIADFNIDILDENFSKSDLSDNFIKQEFLNDLMKHKYTPFFSGITTPSYDNKRGTCIDNFYIKTNNININSFNITNPFNDHYPLFVTIDKLEINQPNKSNSKPINYNKLKHAANNLSWHSILSMQDPNLAINTLIDTINNCIIIATTKQQLKNNLPRKNWITSAIMISCITKETLYTLWKNNLTSELLKKNIQITLRY